MDPYEMPRPSLDPNRGAGIDFSTFANSVLKLFFSQFKQSPKHKPVFTTPQLTGALDLSCHPLPLLITLNTPTLTQQKSLLSVFLFKCSISCYKVPCASVGASSTIGTHCAVVQICHMLCPVHATSWATSAMLNPSAEPVGANESPFVGASLQTSDCG